MSLEMKYYDWEKKYFDIIGDYNVEREQTDDLKNRLTDK